ncbi:hypothetical protein BH23THE1_BH23THE1_29180 [soil metagenome]
MDTSRYIAAINTLKCGKDGKFKLSELIESLKIGKTFWCCPEPLISPAHLRIAPIESIEVDSNNDNESMYYMVAVNMFGSPNLYMKCSKEAHDSMVLELAELLKWLLSSAYATKFIYDVTNIRRKYMIRW